MATAPQPQLPLFYKDLLPLNSRDHGDWKVSSFADATFMASTHAIPLTVDEFVDAQRDYPIVFTAGALYILRLIVKGPGSGEQPPQPGHRAPGNALAGVPAEPELAR